MKNIALLLLLLCLQITGKAQKTFKSSFGEFSMAIPENWIDMDSNHVLRNLDNYSFNEEQFEKLITLNKGSVRLISLAKREATESTGIIPTIKINTRKTETTDINVLKENLKASIAHTLSSFESVSYQQPFIITTINGVSAITATFTYSLPQNGVLLPVRTFLYIFLRKGYFIQVSFSDISERENEQTLFEELIQTISFKK